MIELRSEQRIVVDKAKEILHEKGIVYIAAEVRTGKNIMSLTIAYESGWRRILFVTKLKAISGVEKDFFAMDIGIRVKIINFEQVHKFNEECDGVIIDESHSCFPAGTLVDSKKIEDIKLGDSLKSYNFDKDLVEERVVTNKIIRENNDGWIKVKVNGKEIICTPDHLFFSKRGWIKAKNINETDKLFVLQKTIDITSGI